MEGMDTPLMKTVDNQQASDGVDHVFDCIVGAGPGGFRLPSIWVDTTGTF